VVLSLVVSNGLRSWLARGAITGPVQDRSTVLACELEGLTFSSRRGISMAPAGASCAQSDRASARAPNSNPRRAFVATCGPLLSVHIPWLHGLRLSKTQIVRAATARFSMQAHWRMAQVKAVSSGTRGDLAPDGQGTGKGLARGRQGECARHPGAPRIEPTLP